MTRFYIEGVEARAECCAATVRRLQQGDPQRISDCDVVRMTGETISADTEHEIWLDRTESPGDLAGSLPRVGGGQTEGSGSATVVDPPTRIREPVPLGDPQQFARSVEAPSPPQRCSRQVSGILARLPGGRRTQHDPPTCLSQRDRRGARGEDLIVRVSVDHQGGALSYSLCVIASLAHDRPISETSLRCPFVADDDTQYVTFRSTPPVIRDRVVFYY